MCYEARARGFVLGALLGGEMVSKWKKKGIPIIGKMKWKLSSKSLRADYAVQRYSRLSDSGWK